MPRMRAVIFYLNNGRNIGIVVLRSGARSLSAAVAEGLHENCAEFDTHGRVAFHATIVHF